jgi:hypothetical protein
MEQRNFGRHLEKASGSVAFLFHFFYLIITGKELEFEIFFFLP